MPSSIQPPARPPARPPAGPPAFFRRGRGSEFRATGEERSSRLEEGLFLLPNTLAPPLRSVHCASRALRREGTVPRGRCATRARCRERAVPRGRCAARALCLEGAAPRGHGAASVPRGCRQGAARALVGWLVCSFIGGLVGWLVNRRGLAARAFIRLRAVAGPSCPSVLSVQVRKRGCNLPVYGLTLQVQMTPSEPPDLAERGERLPCPEAGDTVLPGSAPPP